jgi:hypothetical protein
MRDLTDAVLGLFGLRQTKCDDYPAAQLRQIHDSVLCRADIAISPQVPQSFKVVPGPASPDPLFFFA